MIFFVTTFGSIYDRMLPLMEKKQTEGEIVVVATTDQIERFFNEFTPFKILRTNVHPDLIATDTKSSLFINIIRSKLEFRRLFADISNADIFFCNTSWAIVVFSYIQKLSKRNNVFFFGHWKQWDSSTVKYPIERSLRAFFMRWISKWLLGVPTVIRNNKGIPYWCLDKRYFEDITIIDDFSPDHSTLKKYMVDIEIFKGKSILLSIEDSILANTVEKEEFVSKMDHLMDILNSYFPNDFVIKPHPRLNKLYGKMAETQNIIPTHIPFEFVLNHPWKYIIGLDSTSLISSAKQSSAQVISLLDAVQFKDKDFQDMFRNLFENETDKAIIFPPDMRALEKLFEKEKNKVI